jgi:hypothetical protein
MKTEVYSWRVSTDVKTGLERESRRRKLSVSAVLDLAARDWLLKSGSEATDDQEQARLHAEAAKCFGAFKGGNAGRSESVRQDVRKRLQRQNGR